MDDVFGKIDAKVDEALASLGTGGNEAEKAAIEANVAQLRDDIRPTQAELWSKLSDQVFGREII